MRTFQFQIIINQKFNYSIQFQLTNINNSNNENIPNSKFQYSIHFQFQINIHFISET